MASPWQASWFYSGGISSGWETLLLSSIALAWYIFLLSSAFGTKGGISRCVTMALEGARKQSDLFGLDVTELVEGTLHISLVAIALQFYCALGFFPPYLDRRA